MGDLQPGDFVNHRYQVVRCLGRGAMGTVYLAEDVIKVHRLVAMKILRSENLDDPDMWSKGEYQALIRLRHPNLARVFDFGRIQGSKDFFIVSEFIRGQDLLTATRDIVPEELLDIIAQISRALEYIHSQGYVHFDIKPDNILVTRERAVGDDNGSKVMWNADAVPGSSGATGPPRVKLIDFGLAEQIRGTFNFAIKGTFNYVAPEIIRGQTPDKRADLYSFGVTLFQILTGRLPFVSEDGKTVAREGNAWRERLRRILDDQPQYLVDILVRLLEDNPDSRFPTAREIIHALNAGAGRCYQVETAETQASYLYSARLIGRRKELNLLKGEAEMIFGSLGGRPDAETPAAAEEADGDLVARMLNKEGMKRVPLIQLSGEIGVGKSRLLEEFTHFLRMREIPIYSGNCYETSKDAYQPFREIITETALALGRESPVFQKYATTLCRLCPKLRHMVEEEVNEPGFRADKDRLYFMDRLANFIIDAAAATPFVMIINNLHWADESSVELIGYLAAEIMKTQAETSSNLPVMVVTTMRLDEHLPETLRDLLARLRDDECMREILVRRFTRTQIAELIHHMLQIEEIPTSFLNRLEERTSGNPLFLVETLKGLQEEGIISRDGDAWKIRGGDDLARVEIPHGLEAILLRRVRMLDQRQQQILEALAIYDKPMAGRLIERFPVFADIKVMNELRELENRGMVERALDGGRLFFSVSQPKLREIIYNVIPPERCKVLHGALADALAHEYEGRIEEIIEDLAFHYQRSDRVGKALELTVRAGDMSRSIFAHDRAIEHYRHVLVQTEGDPRNRKIWLETHEKIGDIGIINGNYELAEHSYDTLLQVEGCEEFATVDHCRILRKRGKLDEIQGEYDRALRNYHASQSMIDSAAAGAPGIEEEKIRIYNSIGWIYVCMGKYDKAMRISIEALRMTSDRSEKSEHAMIYSTIGSANYFKGNIDQAIEYHTRALEIRENMEDVPEMIVCFNNLGASHLANADYLEAMQYFEQSLATAGEIGDAFGRAVGLHSLAEAHTSIGLYEKAAAYLEESLDLSRKYRMRFLNNQNYLLRGRLRRLEGDLAKAEGDLFRAMGVFAKQGNRWGLACCLYEIAEIHREKSNHAEALKLAREGLANATALKIATLEARGHLLEAKVLERSPATDDAALALEAIEKANKLLEDAKNGELLADAEKQRGDVLVKLGRVAEARDAFRRADECFREVAERLSPELAKIYLDQHQVGTKPGEELSFKEIPDRAPAAPPPPKRGDTSIITPIGGRSAVDAATEHGTTRIDSEMLRLASLLQEANQSVSPRIFVDKVLTCLVQATGADEGFLLSRHGDDVRIVGAVNKRSERLKNPAARICLEVLEDVIDSGEPILAARILDHPQVQAYESLYTNNISSLGVVPLKIDGACRGAVYLNNPRPDQLTPPSGGALLASYCNLLMLVLPRLWTVAAQT